MRTIISKQITALFDDPGDILNYEYFRDIRRRIFNEDQGKQTEEDGSKKKNTMTEIGFGGNSRSTNPGAGMGDDREDPESKTKGIGSGYNDGEAANDEVGPGFTHTEPDPYFTPDIDNSVFFDIKYQKDTGRDSRPMRSDYVKKLLNREPLRPRKRFDVDQLASKQ